MRTLLVFLATCLGWNVSAAIKPVPTRRSQQFLVQDVRSLTPANLEFKPKAGTILLEPDVLVISAEHVRRALFRELALPLRGGGQIQLLLQRASASNPGISIVPRNIAGGWQYQVNIPDHIEDIQLIRGLVQVLLMEFANREAGPKSAEIPLWLNEGLSYHLVASVRADLISSAVPSGMMARTVLELKGSDPLRETRQYLRSHPALSFTELSQMAPADLSADTAKSFQHSAHLIVNELARLPNGKAGLVKMLQALPHFWNWETAFLHAFRPHFERMLEVEKWWSVHAIAFTSRDPTQAWSADVCLQTLDGILLAPAQVRLTTNTLPMRTTVTLQQVVADWPFELQRPVLGQTLNQLAVLRMNCPTNVVPLIDAYNVTLRNYLHRRAEANAAGLSRSRVVLPARLLAQNTVKELDELFRQREVFRRNQITAAKLPNPP